MELINFNYQDYRYLGPLAIALGEFDGLHLAHQELIKATTRFAKKKGLKSAVLSFDPHPDFVLNKRNYQGYLTPTSKKVKAISALGVDYLIIVEFTVDFSKLLPEEFENQVLGCFQIDKIFIGFDYKYGTKGIGNVESLGKKYPLFVLERMDYNNQKIGSEAIRNLLAEGQTEKVAKVLGRYYNISGEVMLGSQIGRTLGIRTANISLEEDYHNLRIGVYAVFVEIDGKRYFGVCNIGHNPTLNYAAQPRLEVHILDFNEEIYGKKISVDFVAFLRLEIKFSKPELLLDQINEDIKNTRRILSAI